MIPRRHTPEAAEQRTQDERMRRECEARARRYLGEDGRPEEKPDTREAVMAWFIMALVVVVAVAFALLLMTAARWLFDDVFSVTNP